MVNETNDAAAHIFDFNLENTKLQIKDHSSNLQRSASGITFDSKEKLFKAEEDPFAVAFDEILLPKSAENLSWKFFEQVSCLDNQLRCDESSALHVNGCHVMTTPRNTTAIGEEHINSNGHIDDETTLGKTNGFMPGATKNLSSQNLNSPDLIQHQHQQLQQQHQQHQQHQLQLQEPQTFQFTSPTATFKRKKQQHQQQQQQQKQQINNNYNSNNRNQQQQKHQYQYHIQQPTTTTTTVYINGQSSKFKSRQQQQHPHQVEPQHATNYKTESSVDRSVDEFNNAATTQTAMISNTCAIINTSNNQIQTKTKAGIGKGKGISTGTGTGTGTIHTLKTHTLPAISVAVHSATIEAAAADDGYDYNDDNDNDNDNDDCEEGIIGKSLNKKSKKVGISNKTRSNFNLNTKENENRGKSKSNTISRQHKKQEKIMGATLQHSADSFVDGIEQHLSVIGWRKKCLFTLLVLVLLLVVINMVLTLWILRVMEFSTDGMGLLKIIPGGVQLTGQAIIMDTLRASTIRSRHGQPIAIESARNFSINTRDTNGLLENHLFLGHDKLECLATAFHINDTAGRNLFSVNRNEVTIGAHSLRIDGEGGAIFRESIQTPHVRAEPGRELRLESPTRQLEMTAARDINLQSRAGGIELSALEDVKLITLDGSLRFESTKILMPNLRTAPAPIAGTAQSREHLHRVFQLCACSNGKLFLASPHSICAGDDSTVCR